MVNSYFLPNSYLRTQNVSSKGKFDTLAFTKVGGQKMKAVPTSQQAGYAHSFLSVPMNIL